MSSNGQWVDNFFGGSVMGRIEKLVGKVTVVLRKKNCVIFLRNN